MWGGYTLCPEHYRVIDLKERMHTCMTSGEHNEVALLKAALSLGEEMSDHAVM